MKKISIMALLVIFLLTGCKKNETINHYLEISYKNSRHDPFGIFAAEYKGKLYYFSDEAGNEGIYQMDLNGSDNMFLIPCSDIDGIQIIDDSIYLLALQEVNDKGEALYNVEKYSLDGKFLKTILDDNSRDFYAGGRFRGVDGFFVDEYQNAFFNLSINNIKRRKVDKSTYFQDKSWKPIGQVLKEITSLGQIRGKYFSIYQVKNNYLVNNAGVELSKQKSGWDTYKSASNAHGYNSTFDRSWWNNKDNANKWDGECRIWHVIDNEIVLSMDNILFIYDMDQGDVTWEVEVPMDELNYYFNEEIVHVLYEDGELYVVLECNTPSIFKKEDDESEQTLYRIDRDTGEVKELYNCGIEGKIIYMEDNFFVSYANHTFKLHKKENDDWNVVWDDTIEDEIKEIGYQVDIAGNWLFVKRFDQETKEASLVNKINIEYLNDGLLDLEICRLMEPEKRIN